jgi:hypothetical protein
VLALASPAADLGHVTPISADSFAAFLPGGPRLRCAELVRRALLMSSAAALGSDLPLPFVAHAREATAASTVS